MIDLKDIFALKEKLSISSQHMPKHVAVSMHGSFSYAAKKKLDNTEVAKRDFEIVKDIIEVSADCNIPVLTFYVVAENIKKSKNYLIRVDALADFFKAIREWEFLHKKQIKITFLGKWYDMPSNLIDEIKQTISDTKDYDAFFVNFCINYDGQEEIVDALKLIARKLDAGKLEPDEINKEVIKDNIYSSYFLPPDLIIKTGKIHTLYGFLLWDSVNSRIYFADKLWPDFNKADFFKAIQFYQNRR